MKNIKISVDTEEDEMRVDKLVSSKVKELSRQYVKRLLDEGRILVNKKNVKSSNKLKMGDIIEIRVPTPKKVDLQPMMMDLEIVFEDNDILVINKPHGLVVHPGVLDTHREDSLVNALLHHCKGNLSSINGVLRPGIVHRLDKDTSGLMVVAKSDIAHKNLADQFKNRNVKKIYLVLLVGRIDSMKGIIDSPIGRDSRNRKKMAVVGDKRGREAVSRFEVLEYIKDCSFARINLLTGRTHQIRVHFSSIGYAVAGDPIYGDFEKNIVLSQEYGLNRLFLHSAELSFKHPVTERDVVFESKLPKELKDVMEKMNN